jgi:tetratricopeptide (TPR) repeat protein
MRMKGTTRQSPAYAPTLASVQDGLSQAGPALRQLLFKSAMVGSFDSKLLARLQGDDVAGSRLVEEVELTVPVERVGDDRYSYDVYTREALLEIAHQAGHHDVLKHACQEAVDYYEEQARQAGDESLRRKLEDQVLYFKILSEPRSGFSAWIQEWQKLADGPRALVRKGELIGLARTAWRELSDVPGAQPAVLLRQGWLAYNNGDWQVANSAFGRILGPASSTNALARVLYLAERRPRPLTDGTTDYLLEGEANIGLGYSFYRQGALAEASRHFEKASRVIDAAAARQDPAAATLRSRALCGLGHVASRMSAADDVILRCLLLPGQQRRTPSVESRPSTASYSLEELARARLADDARTCFEEALDITSDHPRANPDWRRAKTGLGRLLLENGDWESAVAVLEEVRRLELDAIGIDAEEATALERHPDAAGRLAWLNLSIGDCLLLSGYLPGGAAGEFPSGPVTLNGADAAESQAMAHYQAAWSIWKGLQSQDEHGVTLRSEDGLESTRPEHQRRRHDALMGMAMSLRRQGDLHAVDAADAVRLDRASHCYRLSLELYEKMGDRGEVARALERIECLRARAARQHHTEPAEDQRESSLPCEPSEDCGSSMHSKGQAQVKGSEEQRTQHVFEDDVHGITSTRPTFFRYWQLRRLARRVQRLSALLVFLAAVTGTLALWGALLLVLGGRVPSASPAVLGFALVASGIVVLVALAVLSRPGGGVPKTQRLAVRLLPIRWLWLNERYLSIDHTGISLYDHTGQSRRLIRWENVRQVRGQNWVDASGTRHRTMVFGPRQDIGFDQDLRDYGRLQNRIAEGLRDSTAGAVFADSRRAILLTDLTEQRAFGAAVVPILLTLLILLAFLADSGRTSGVLLVALTAGLLALAVMGYREWRWMRPRRRPM